MLVSVSKVQKEILKLRQHTITMPGVELIMFALSILLCPFSVIQHQSLFCSSYVVDPLLLF